MLTWLGSRNALALSRRGSLPWKGELADAADRLVAELADRAANPDRSASATAEALSEEAVWGQFPAALDAEAAARTDAPPSTRAARPPR